jgi:hypothetical protein
MGTPNVPHSDSNETSSAVPAAKPTTPETFGRHSYGVAIDTAPAAKTEVLTPAENLAYITFRAEATKKLSDVRFRTSLEGLNEQKIAQRIRETVGPLPEAAQKHLKGRNFKHLSTIKTENYLVEVNMQREQDKDADLKIDVYNRHQFRIDGTYPENKSDVKPLRQWLEFKNEAIRVLAGVKNEADLKKMEPAIDNLIKTYGITNILKDPKKATWPVNHLVTLDLGDRLAELHVAYDRKNEAKNKNNAAWLKLIPVVKPAPEKTSKTV